MTCDDFQIAFDQQQAGAPSAIAAAEVAAHVATCASCTAYVAVSEQVSTSMSSTLSRSAAPLEIDAIFMRVAEARRGLARSVVLLPVTIAAVMFFYFAAERGFTPRGIGASLVGAVGGAAVGYAMMRVMMHRRLAELRTLEGRYGDTLLTGWRDELDRRIRTERQNWWVLPLVLFVFHAVFFGPTLPALPIVALEILYLAIPIPISVRRYQRLVRERDLLGG